MTYVPHSFGMSNAGNTAGDTGVVSNRLVFAGGNNITLSQATNASGSASMTIIGGAGAGAFSGGISSNLGNTSGTTGMVGSQIVFAGGNNITLSQSVNAASATITVSAGNAGGDGYNSAQFTNSTANSTMPIVWAGNSGGSGNVTIGLTDSTVTASAPSGGGGNTLSSYEPYPFHGTGTGSNSLSSNTSAVQMMFPFIVNEPVAAEYVNIIANLTVTTGGTSSFRQSGTMHWGLFTRPTGANSSRLSAMDTGSFGYFMTYNNSSISINQPTSTNSTGYGTADTNSAGLNISSAYTGSKLIGLYLGTTLTAGQYWLGLHHRQSSSSFNSGIRMSIVGNSVTQSALAPIGSYSSAFSTGTNIVGMLGGNWQMGLASYSDGAGQTALATDVTISQMTQNFTVMPYMKFISRV